VNTRDDSTSPRPPLSPFKVCPFNHEDGAFLPSEVANPANF